MLHNGTLLPFYAVLVWGLMLGRGPLHRALSMRPLTVLGDSSYVLYTLQVPLMQWMVLAAGRRYDAMDARFTAIALVLTVASADRHPFPLRDARAGVAQEAPRALVARAAADQHARFSNASCR